METPEKIYLQWPDQEPPEGSSEIDPEYITWCQDRIEDHDVEYVRKDLLDQALAEIARRHGIGVELFIARKERDELRQDAERYRWLRDVAYHAAAGPNGEMVWCVTGEGCGNVTPIHGQDLDDAIDATINMKSDELVCHGCGKSISFSGLCDECYDKESDSFSIVRAMEKI